MKHLVSMATYFLVIIFVGGWGCGELELNEEYKGDAVLYEEDFDSLGGSFKCNNRTCSWNSEVIDISGAENITISANAKSYLPDELDNPDYLRLFYRIDGGDWVRFFNHTNDLAPTEISEDVSSTGSTLEIKINSRTSFRRETYEVDNLIVTGELASNVESLPYHETFASLGGSFTCSNKTCSWTSNPINISGADNLEINADASCHELGEFDPDDYLKMYYKIDGGNWIRFFNHTGDLNPTEISRSVSETGSRMKIKIDSRTSFVRETYEVDNLRVMSGGPPPEEGCGDIDGDCLEIEPEGRDHSEIIQDALESLDAGDGLLLTGDFVIYHTIYIPSNITWVLDGTLTLGDDADLDQVVYENPSEGIRVAKRTGITEVPGGATNIVMRGGTYYGNAENNHARGTVRFLRFIEVRNSVFRDMVIENASDDNFTLGPESRDNECWYLTARFAGLNEDNSGNGLTDRGERNRWYHCIAEDCTSDGWTPKSRNSEFHNCVARRNRGPGFGLYARVDGTPQSDSRGATLSGNLFIACESYDNHRGGISFDISSNCPGGIIRDNYVEGVFYNNRMSGVIFRNKQDDGLIDDNEVDILSFNNRGETSTPGNESSLGAGLAVDGGSGREIRDITGNVVAYGNGGGDDVDIRHATSCELTVHNPSDRSPAEIDAGSGNTVTERSFSCPTSSSVWAIEEYCRRR